MKEVLLMVLAMHIEEDDTMLHIVKTGMLMLVIEVDVGGMAVNVVDKLTCSSDDVQPKQVDMRSAHALSELHWHDTHERQNSLTAGSSRPYTSRSSGTSAKQRVIMCYNYKGEGHMSEQYTKPKRRKDEQWFKDKVLLVQAQENGQVLQEEEL
nr:retrovirus-related Pol polyprotein from transposon TNT 1-94 [Tanacetum cinerariifolium]